MCTSFSKKTWVYLVPERNGYFKRCSRGHLRPLPHLNCYLLTFQGIAGLEGKSRHGVFYGCPLWHTLPRVQSPIGRRSVSKPLTLSFISSCASFSTTWLQTRDVETWVTVLLLATGILPHCWFIGSAYAWWWWVSCPQEEMFGFHDKAAFHKDIGDPQTTFMLTIAFSSLCFPCKALQMPLRSMPSPPTRTSCALAIFWLPDYNRVKRQPTSYTMRRTDS